MFHFTVHNVKICMYCYLYHHVLLYNNAFVTPKTIALFVSDMCIQA